MELSTKALASIIPGCNSVLQYGRHGEWRDPPDVPAELLHSSVPERVALSLRWSSRVSLFPQAPYILA